jgi:hypothetical protein
MAFGFVFGIAAWFLLHKTLLIFVQHLQRAHNRVWEKLDRPNVDSPRHIAFTSVKLRQYILHKEYAVSSDLFVNNMGGLLRQRLLFCYFCLGCLIVGIGLMLIVTTIN